MFKCIFHFLCRQFTTGDLVFFQDPGSRRQSQENSSRNSRSDLGGQDKDQTFFKLPSHRHLKRTDSRDRDHDKKSPRRSPLRHDRKDNSRRDCGRRNSQERDKSLDSPRTKRPRRGKSGETSRSPDRKSKKSDRDSSVDRKKRGNENYGVTRSRCGNESQRCSVEGSREHFKELAHNKTVHQEGKEKTPSDFS